VLITATTTAVRATPIRLRNHKIKILLRIFPSLHGPLPTVYGVSRSRPHQAFGDLMPSECASQLGGDRELTATNTSQGRTFWLVREGWTSQHQPVRMPLLVRTIEPVAKAIGFHCPWLNLSPHRQMT